ncbi:condensation domain-containing protein [Streptomyces purpurogeneiscleroticus]|uniref:condensation domain-containing protein n=1 Tax=Streptomyces purpurogeneiscleroticus TaxID=68259 RepID=UPI001CC04689|nr:condensation domain-containing protein [Streptomyces purpurogeneiscleroticus]
MLSGDWIPVDLPGRLRGLVPGVDVVSLGGATEAAIWSIAYPVGEVDAAWESIPYGMPLRNQRFHVLNDRWQECPVHVPGELFIGGVGLAEGYWNDPERTAASFVTHPDTGERLYRTGDLGRWTPQGHIEFLGREDFQVKIGGFRIELGEIETALARHPQVAAAIAAAPGDRHHRRLIGYVVPEQRGDAAADEELLESVRALITDQLPGYMVPPTLTVLDRLPLSANGKLDRSALPDPATTAQATGRRADLGPTAAKLAALAAEVIGTADIDPYGDFFTLGGDSIMGVQLVSRAGAQGMEILAADLFRHRTIAELAAVVDQRSEGRQGQARGLLPLAPFQRELFAHAEEALPTAAQVFALPVDPDFAPETGTRVLAQLLRRHPGLRMRFVQDGDGSWRQTDAAWSEEDTQRLAYVPLIDLSALPEDRRERAVEQMTAEMREELDPQAGPLVKVALFDLGAGGRRLVWLCHLLIADLRSLQLLLTDFSDAARQLRDGSDRADLLPPTRPFPRWVEQAAEHTTDPVEAMQPLLQAYGDGAVYRLSTVVDEDAAERLLSGAADAYRLSGQEVALAALAAAVFAGTDRENVLLAVEDDARALVLGDLDVSGSVGSFSRTIPVALQRPTDERPESLLTAAKDQLRTAVRQETLPAPSPAAQSVLLRDLDALAELPRLGHPFVPEGPVTPPYWDPGIAPGHPLVLTTYKLAGRWHLDWLCRGDEARALAEQLTGHLTEALHTFIDHCTSVGAGAVSVSDFPLADLDPATLAALTASLNGTPPGDDATTDPTDGTTTEVNR